MHAYFDISYLGQGNLVQADNNATYMFSKICTCSEPLARSLTYLPSHLYLLPDCLFVLYSSKVCQQIPVPYHTALDSETCDRNFYLLYNCVKVYDTITLDGYQVFGLCQFNGSLDYVVALDIASNELRVIRFTFSGSTGVINDYKKVDKDDLYKKLTGTVFVDCAYQTTFKGQNTYTIGIAGTYFHSN